MPDNVLKFLCRLSSDFVGDINIICWEEYTDNTVREVLYRFAKVLNMIFPPFKFAKFFHIHLLRTPAQTELIANFMLMHGHQGSWAGITHIGGTQGGGHSPWIRLLTHFAKLIYDRVRTAGYD